MAPWNKSAGGEYERVDDLGEQVPLEDIERAPRGSSPSLALLAVLDLLGRLAREQEEDRYPIAATGKMVPRKYVFWMAAAFVLLWVGLLVGYHKTVQNSPAHSRPTAPSPAFAPPKISALGKKVFGLDSWRFGYLYGRHADRAWVAAQGPLNSTQDSGCYTHLGNKVEVKHAGEKDKSTTVVPFIDFDHKGVRHLIRNVQPLLNLSRVLLESDVSAEWRHSSDGFYWVYDNATQKVEPLTPHDSDEPVVVSFAHWLPRGLYIYYVHDNDLYIRLGNPGSKLVRVTNDGLDAIMNGKPDWVYEEEVLAGDLAVWWLPDEKLFAYLKTNDSLVPDYDLQYFVKKIQLNKYPITKPVRYPKPGYPNPVVLMVHYTVEGGKSTVLPAPEGLGAEFIVYDASWVDTLLVIKQTDRTSSLLQVRVFDRTTGATTTPRTFDGRKEKVWTEKAYPLIVVPPTPTQPTTGYVDVVLHNGFRHLAYFESVNASSPTRMLTEGNWEIVGEPLAYDGMHQVVYFQLTEKSLLELKIGRVHVHTGQREYVTPLEQEGTYSALFLPGLRFIHLKYEGPGTPADFLVDNTDTQHNTLESAVKIPNFSTVDQFKEEYDMPSKTYHELVMEGEGGKELNTIHVREVLPPNFDPSRKYPMLVTYYAGPGLATLQKSYSMSFSEVVACSLDAVVLYVEPRGTGNRGDKFREFAYDQIGHYEPRDITAAAREWIDNKGYISANHTACWGWLYGGFTTLKVLEYDGGKTFRYGMAVAPVTDWLLYDSVYTERYMHLPKDNKAGYEDELVVRVVAQLLDTERFLIMHGTADDNVHFQNTLQLLDKFDLARVENYDVHVFPDSNHNIATHNANQIVYDKLFHWLQRAFTGGFVEMRRLLGQ